MRGETVADGDPAWAAAAGERDVSVGRRAADSAAAACRGALTPVGARGRTVSKRHRSSRLPLLGDTGGAHVQGSAQPARRIVPAPGGRVVAHARGGRVDLRRASRPRTTACWRTSSRASAWCRATGSGWREVPFAQARPRWVDDERFDLRYPRAPHGAAGAGERVRAAGARGARVLPAAAARPAAVGDVAGRGPGGWPLRDPLQDAPRAGRRCLGAGHPERAVRARRRRSPGAVAPEAVALDAPGCWPRRCSSARRTAGELRAPAARRRARPRRRSAGSRRRVVGAGALAWAGLAAGAADAVQRRQGRARPAFHVDARVARGGQGDQERARRDGQRCRADRGHAGAAPAPVAARRGRRRARAEGVRAGERAQRGPARDARQPGLGDDRPTLPVCCADPARVPGDDLRADARGQGVRAGRRRAGADRAQRLRAADAARTRRPGWSRASASSTSS